MNGKREKIRGMVEQYCLTYVWLVNQLNKRGMDVTSNELCHYVTGRRRGERAERVLNLCIQILECYVELYELKLVDDGETDEE